MLVLSALTSELSQRKRSSSLDLDVDLLLEERAENDGAGAGVLHLAQVGDVLA